MMKNIGTGTVKKIRYQKIPILGAGSAYMKVYLVEMLLKLKFFVGKSLVGSV
jgi:hypothetical protein